MILLIAHTQEVTYFYTLFVIILYIICSILKNWISKYFFKYSLHPFYFFLGDCIGLLGYIFFSDYIYDNQIIGDSEVVAFFVPFFPFILSHFIIFYFFSSKNAKNNSFKKSLLIGMITPSIFWICSDLINEIIK